MLHANRFIQSFFRLPVSARHSFSFLLGEFWGMVDDPDELFQMILDVKQEVEKVVSIRSQIEGIDAFQNHMASLRWNSKSLQKNAFLRDYWENKFNCSISEKTCNSEDFLEPITRPIVRHVVAPLVIDSIYTITAYLDNFTKANTGQSVYYNNQKSIQEGSNHPVTKITSWTGNIISLIHPSAPPMGWLQPSRWVYEFLLLNTTGNQTEQNQYVLLGKWEINNGNRTLEFDDTTHSWNSETSVTCLIPNTVDPTEMPSFTLSQEIDLEVSSIQPNQAQPPTTTNSSLKCSHTKVIGLVAVPIGIAVFHVLFGIFFVVRKGWPTVRHSALSLGGVLLIIDSIVVILIAILIVSNALPSLECDNLILDFLINTFGCVCYAALLVKLLSQSGSTLNQFTARLSVYVLIVSIQMTLSGLAFFNFNIKDTLYQTNADHCLEARQHIMVVVAYWYNVAINVFSVVTLLIAYCGQHQLMFNSKPQVVVAVATTCFIFQAVAVSILLWTSNCLVHSAFLVVTAVYPAIVTLAISVTTTMSSVLKKRYLDENGIPTSISVRRDLPRIQSHHYISNLMQNSAFLSLQIFLEDDVIKEMHDVVIDPNRLDVGKEIGKGNFGEVLQGKLDGTVPVAIKSIQSRLSQSEVNSFIKEGLQMKNLNHPNVMELIGICWSDDPTNERHVSPYIVLPFMDLGDLKTFLRKRRPNRRTEVPDNPSKEPIDLVQLVKFGHQIARGMEYISAKGIIHRDLAARNCMINWNQEIKVADFGLARTTVEGKEYYRMGQGGELPIRWMALESLVYMTFDVKTDVWSYGVTLWEVMTLAQVPYPGRQNQDVIALLRSGQRLERPENCPEEIYEIMSQCWDVYPESRPSFTSIVELLEEFLSEAMNYFDPTTPKLVEPPTDLPTPQQSEEMEEEKQSKEPDNACACACDVAADSKDAMATVIANESLTDELRPKTDVECKLETTETLNEAVDERAEETTATSNSD
ncbi:uncharacterized protein LOC134181228 [Corticium candelabrum]|uniref:uncharacterized protein LOC134181228 n=1 Tax=Corticium candelabrum TaxID=121492 RepID=UPI002E264C7C|nr:uncharacterized protein LOC134181228 [Corticium candelabrum]